MTLYILYACEYKEGSKRRRRRRVKNNRILYTYIYTHIKYSRGGLMNINTSIFYINEFIYTAGRDGARDWDIQ